MSAAVDALLACGVTAELLSCLGVAVMRTTFDRLHYLAAGTTVGPFLVLAALLLREGFGTLGLESIAAVGLLFLMGPVLQHATARAARRIDYGGVEAAPGEKGP